MADNTPTVEAPPDPTKPPVFPKQQSVDPTFGNKFREALSKLTVPEEGKPPAAEPQKPPSAEPPPPLEETTKPPGETTAPEKVEKPEIEAPPAKPSSALEAALGEEKAPEPKDELAEFEKIETPKGSDWEKARAVMKRQSEELKTLKSAPPKVDVNVEAITKENEELKGRVEKLNTNLKAINAEYSEDYQKLQTDREKAVNKVASRMKYSGSEKVDDLVTALNMPDGRLKNSAVKEAIADLDADDKIAVRALIERVDEADEKIADFRKDLPGQWDKLQAQRENETRQRQEQQDKQLESEFQKVLGDLPKEIIRLRSVPDDVTGAKEWNEPIRAAIDNAFTALKPNGTDFKQTVSIAVKGNLFDAVWNDYKSTMQELREARARIKEFEQSGPDFRGQVRGGKEAELSPTQKYHQALAARQGSAAAP